MSYAPHLQIHPRTFPWRKVSLSLLCFTIGALAVFGGWLAGFGGETHWQGSQWIGLGVAIVLDAIFLMIAFGEIWFG